MRKDSDRKNIDIEIVIYLHVFDTPDYVQFFLECHLSLCTDVPFDGA
jgi:hypothetical protein